MIRKISDSSFLFDYFKEKYELWLLTRDKKKRKQIEDIVYNFINNNMDDAIYITASDGRATGLCAYPYFEKDLKKLINVLESMS